MTLAALILTLLTMLLLGLMTGLFFMCSNALMPALDKIDPHAAIAAMRSINSTILNKLFLASFMLPTVTGIVAGILWSLDGQSDAGIAAFVTAGVYLFGNQVVTSVLNVPMNNALEAATVPDDKPAAAKLWTDYSGKWTRWNSFRGFACAVSLGLSGLTLHLA